MAEENPLVVLDAMASADIAPKVAEIMDRELKNDSAWIDKEVTEYNKLLLTLFIK